MSFRQNGRYGHVPPAQYAGTPPRHNSGLGLQRRPSFDAGDDSLPFDSTGQQGLPTLTHADHGYSDATAPEGLSINGLPPAPPRMPYGNAAPAQSGTQHQYQPSSPPSTQPISPTGYNPQQFARAYPQSHVTTNYSPQAYSSQAYSPVATFNAHQTYNPAAYQSQASLQRQQTLPTYGQSPSLASPQQQQSPPSWAQPGQYTQAPAIPQRHPTQQVYSPPLHVPFVPSASAPLPLRQAQYTPPTSSAPYPTNGTGYTANNHRSATDGPQSYSTHTQMPMPASYLSSVDDFESQSASRSSSRSNAPYPISSFDPNPTSLQRHPTLRPLPSAPVETGTTSGLNKDYEDETPEDQVREQLYQDIENAVMESSLRSSAHQSGHRQNSVDLLDTELGDLRRSGHRAGTFNPTDVGRTRPNEATHNRQNSAYSFDDDDDSDAEAAAGNEAMRIAEEQESQGGIGTFGVYPSSRGSTDRSQQVVDDASSDSDYALMDMGFYSGGYDAHMSYGDDVATIGAGHSSEMDDQSRPLPTPHDLRRSDGYESVNGLGGMQNYALPAESELHPFPAFEAARVDVGGTGGLQRPSSQNHRLSFDEGEEFLGSRYAESRFSGYSGSDSPTRDDIPEMFYHPGMSTSPAQRPLPAVPQLHDNRTPYLQPASGYRNSPYHYHHSSSSDVSRHSYLPDGPDAYGAQDLLNPNAPFVPRSASLSSHSSTPQVIPPVRSRTDAEERQARQRSLRPQGVSGSTNDAIDIATSQSTIPLDLPALPLGRRRKISPTNLRSQDFKRCQEPWALSAIAEWAKDICGGEPADGESDLRKKVVAECLVALFTHKVPTMNTTDAEVLSDRIVNDMLKAGVLVRDEEWVKFGPGFISGVLWQMTGSGCYAPRLHDQEIAGRCYSHHCGRTLKKINLQSDVFAPAKKAEDWHVFFHLTKQQMEAGDKKEIHRQNALHEIIVSEDRYMTNLNVLRVLYRDQLQSWQPPIIAPQKIARFIALVFGNVEAIKVANQEHLLAQLKYRQKEQGPWIAGFSDIFREWVRRARQVYLEYAAGYSNAVYMVNREAEKNILFRQFLDQARDNKLSDRLDWKTYLFAPLKRLQQYTLMLREVLKSSVQETEEKANLVTAIDEINAVTLECDAKVDEEAKKVEMIELSHKLFLRPGMERVELHLDHLGRQLIFKGDLQRAGSNRFTWLETHALLFDHYLVLAKAVSHRDTAGRKKDAFDVSKVPIPMELLVLESTNEEAVVKSAVKGLAVTTVARPPTSEPRTRSSTLTDRPNNLEHTNTNSSLNSVTKTVTATSVENDTRAMYPFRVKHLGRSEVYTLYAPSAQNRQDWCEKIIEAKERYAASLFAQNAEPFRLRIMADSAFTYDTMGALGKGSSIPINGTPLDRAIREMEREYGPTRPGPVCRAVVNCGTSFTSYGKEMVAIGTDYGVYITEASNPRGWTRSIQMNRVTQIAVIEDFSLCLIIADKSLIAYHLDVIAPPSSAGGYSASATDNSSPRRAPQKLSGSKDVAFFATARMKDRTLVFYKKREGLSSTFKVLEPVYQKSSEKKSRLFGRIRAFDNGNSTEFFREFDEFYIPSDCFTINLFKNYVAISTARGFELLTLDRKVPMSIPDLKEPGIATIATRLSGQRPLGMFKLNDEEFLLCYEECGVYIDKHGSVSRSVILQFVGKAKTAAMYGDYLVLFDSDFVEVRNAENGRLRQIIAGKDVRCLDNGVTGASSMQGQRTLKVALTHPEINGSQLVIELLLNEGHTE
ncbi:MAG: hypothetical protein M1818_007377 [Claussenomyces sp. TS43310]|nr:MAG: hypothetical protein M1818_007377 [Claussenomyces sp. TS43310]